MRVWDFETAGDEHARLGGWLDDVTRSRGVYYQLVRTAANLLMAFLVGASSNGGLTQNAHAVSWCLMGIQLTMAFYCFCMGRGADRLEGEVSGAEALLGALTIFCLYVNSLGEEEEEEEGLGALNGSIVNGSGALLEDGGNGTAAAAAGPVGTHWQSAALIAAVCGTLAPLGLALYDGFVLPCMEAITNRDRKLGLVVCCRNLLVMPVLVLTAFGSGAAATSTTLNVTAEVTEDVIDAALEVKGSEVIKDGAMDAIERGRSVWLKNVSMAVQAEGEAEGEAAAGSSRHPHPPLVAEACDPPAPRPTPPAVPAAPIRVMSADGEMMDGSRPPRAGQQKTDLPAEAAAAGPAAAGPAAARQAASEAMLKSATAAAEAKKAAEVAAKELEEEESFKQIAEARSERAVRLSQSLEAN
jgi:hypothetical protein